MNSDDTLPPADPDIIIVISSNTPPSQHQQLQKNLFALLTNGLGMDISPDEWEEIFPAPPAEH